MVETANLSAEAERLMPAIEALSLADRFGIARRLLRDSLPDEDPPEEVEAAWKDEVRRRVAEIRSGEVTGIAVEDMFERSREKYP